MMNHRNSKKILLADNLREYRRSVIGFLALESYEVSEASTPEEAREKLDKEQFDLALVDLRLRDDNDTNDMSGLEVAKFASQCGIPSILITAFPSVELARVALRSRGAEPYAEDLITKGSDPQAVLDSISITLGTRDARKEKPALNGTYLDLDRKLVLKDGQIIKTSKNQYALLEELYKKDGGVCSHAELIRAIYGEPSGEKDAQNDRRLRNLVERTKDKIEDPGSTHEYLEAVSGRGYRLNLKI
jgi:DNA-binding response OmpR family regulator